MWYCTEREFTFQGGNKWVLYSSGKGERKVDSVTKQIDPADDIFSWTLLSNVLVAIYWILLHGHCRTYSHGAKISEPPYFLSSLNPCTSLYSSDCQDSLKRAVQVPWKVWLCTLCPSTLPHLKHFWHLIFASVTWHISEQCRHIISCFQWNPRLEDTERYNSPGQWRQFFIILRSSPVNFKKEEGRSIVKAKRSMGVGFHKCNFLVPNFILSWQTK